MSETGVRRVHIDPIFDLDDQNEFLARLLAVDRALAAFRASLRSGVYGTNEKADPIEHQKLRDESARAERKRLLNALPREKKERKEIQRKCDESHIEAFNVGYNKCLKEVQSLLA